MLGLRDGQVSGRQTLKVPFITQVSTTNLKIDRRNNLTSKKAKNSDLIHKTDFTKFKPKEGAKKKTQNTKRIDTFAPIQDLEDTKKTDKNKA